MPTTITEAADLDRTPAQVLAALGDEAFVLRRCTAEGSLSGQLLQHLVTSSAIEIVTTARVPAEWLPSRVRAAVDSLPMVTRRESWDRRSGTGRTEFDFTGVPARAAATMSLDPRPAGCRVTHILELAVYLPFVGALVEQDLGRRIGAALRTEFSLYAAVDAHSGAVGDGADTSDIGPHDRAKPTP
ncbi:MAG: DUF2505 domain-containing protein [Actinomycetales bacterium]|nr:DUF2505 domain-containing protein [Actinomycetales bacterium]